MKYELSIESGVFSGLTRDFDELLKRTLSTMRQKEGEKAEIKMSLKITLTEAFIDAEEEGSQREAVLPKFEHKITSVMQYKDELNGIVGGEEYELAWDSKNQNWCMKKIEDKQMNLFEGNLEDIRLVGE